MSEHRVVAHLGVDAAAHPLATELAQLGDAGFARPDCFWKQGASTVFGSFV